MGWIQRSKQKQDPSLKPSQVSTKKSNSCRKKPNALSCSAIHCVQRKILSRRKILISKTTLAAWSRFCVWRKMSTPNFRIPWNVALGYKVLLINSEVGWRPINFWLKPNLKRSLTWKNWLPNCVGWFLTKTLLPKGLCKALLSWGRNIKPMWHLRMMRWTVCWENSLTSLKMRTSWLNCSSERTKGFMGSVLRRYSWKWKIRGCLLGLVVGLLGCKSS